MRSNDAGRRRAARGRRAARTGGVTAHAALAAAGADYNRRRGSPRRASARKPPRDRDAPPDAHVRILDIIRRIPRGRVMTYGGVAQAAGLPRRARLVGFVLRNSPLADGVPWHRVVAAPGRIAVRDGGGDEQIRRLRSEGVTVDVRGRLSLKQYAWRPVRYNVGA